jgi:type III secretion protein Q
MAEANNVIEFRDAWAMYQEPGAPQVSTGPIADSLVTIDAPTRDAINEWLNRRCAPLFKLGPEEFELRWLESAGDVWHVAIELSVGSQRALLVLDSLAALDPLLVGEPFTLMPHALRDLAVQRFAARILSYAPPVLANAMELRAIHWDGGGLPEWRCRLPFVLQRRSDGTRLTGALLFENALGLKWLHDVLPVDRMSDDVRLSLPALARLSLGKSTISSASLTALAAGDVVWIETASINREGVAVELTAPAVRRNWRCRVRRESLRIVAAAEFDTGATQQRASPSISPAVSGTGAHPMDAQRWQLEVPVTFDLGELQLKVADLERLQPGQIIELQQDVATATVSLRVAERCIAEGTLIAIGKRLGVRISTVIAQRETGAA